MKIGNRPLPVLIVSVIFILTGIMGIITHRADFTNPDISRPELVWTLLVRILAIVCGVLLLYRVNWARLLAIVWLLYHVAIGAFHSTNEVVSHLIILAIVLILLYMPVSTRYFREKKSA